MLGSLLQAEYFTEVCGELIPSSSVSCTDTLDALLNQLLAWLSLYDKG